MMYRSGWGQKENQERVLAVRISREGFDTILSQALTGIIVIIIVIVVIIVKRSR